MQYVELERKFMFIQQVSVFVCQENTGLQASLQQSNVFICCLVGLALKDPLSSSLFQLP